MTTDRRAVEADLVRDHPPLTSRAVNELARRLPAHVHRDDLLSAAMLGLAQAARSWDPERGASFERHAVTRIRGALLDELRGSDWASRSVRSRARRMARADDDRPSRPAPTTAPAWTRRRGYCWNGYPPESLAGQRIRSINLRRVTFRRLPRKVPGPAPFQAVCSVRTSARKGRGG
jgi:RNA polymerase sigma factor (sigma-70 family)